MGRGFANALSAARFAAAAGNARGLGACGDARATWARLVIEEGMREDACTHCIERAGCLAAGARAAR